MSPLPMHAKTNCFWNMTQKNFSRPECDLETPSAVTLLEQPAGRPNFRVWNCAGRVTDNPAYGATSCWDSDGGGAALGSATLCGSRMRNTVS